MPPPAVSKKSLISNIGYVQFDDQRNPNVIERIEALFENLSEYRTVSIAEGRPTVSDGAIRGWLFNNPPSVPKRHEALNFLHGYFLWKNRPASELHGARKVYFEAIVKFFVTVGALESQYIRGRLPDKPENVAISSRGRGGGVDNHLHLRPSLAQVSSLSGSYQIIRPFVNSTDKYVLEPMSIEIDTETKKPIMRMYSHNQPRSMFMYIGNLILTTRYMFATIQRQHEYDREASAVRCVSIYADQQEVGSEIIARPCLSGILMRGVQGNKGERGPVAIPFVAIKLQNDPADIGAPEFEYLHRYLRRMSRDSFILIGEVGRDNEPIFGLCDSIFSRIRSQAMKSDHIGTLSPDNVSDMILPHATRTEEYEYTWRQAVNLFFAEYDLMNKKKQSSS